MKRMDVTAKQVVLALTFIMMPWVIGGCTTALDVPQGALIGCSTDADCPEGYECDVNSTEDNILCVPIGQDTDPPGVTNLVVDLVPHIPNMPTPLPAPGGGVVSIAFSADEALGAEPVVRLAVGSSSASAWQGPATQNSGTSDVAPSFVYHYTVQATDPEGMVDVVIEVEDVLGNRDVLTFPDRVLIDRTKPQVATVTPVGYQISESAQVFFNTVEVATNGVSVEIGIGFNESLGPQPALWMVPSGTAIDAALPGCHADIASVTCGVALKVQDINPFYIFSMAPDQQPLWSDGRCNGTFDLVLEAYDRAGNRQCFGNAQLDGVLKKTDGCVAQSGNTLCDIDVDIDVTAPSAPTNLRFVRVPWGSKTLGSSQGAYSIEANNAGSPPVENLAWLVAYTDGMGTAEISRIQTDALGQIPGSRFILSIADRVDVYVMAVDGAGNQSSIVPVATGRWVASLGGKKTSDFVSNPHRLQISGSDYGSLFGARLREPVTQELQNIYPEGLGSVTIGTEHEWRQRAQRTPRAVSSGAMAHMSSHGKTVLIGGQNAEHGFELMWEWDGIDWRPIDLVNTVHPGARLAPGLTYDNIRDRVVLHGGSLLGLDAAAQTWEWDGGTWAQLTPASGTGLPAAFMIPLSFDSQRGKAVLPGVLKTTDPLLAPACPSGAGILALDFCFEGATWEWDGTQWEKMCDGSTACPVPPVRFQHASAYHAASKQTIIFGGARCTTAECTPVGSLSFVALSDTWAWGPDATGVMRWRQVANGVGATSPPARSGHTMFYDSAASEIVLMGGCTVPSLLECASSGSELSDIWGLDYDAQNDVFTWTQKTNTQPQPRAYATSAYDSSRNEWLLFGGGREATGSPVSNCSTLVNPCAEGFEMRPSGGNQCECLFTSMWRYDGIKWNNAMAPSDRPKTQRGMGMTYNELTAQTVVFGGGLSDQGACGLSQDPGCHELWQWDGASWSRPYALDMTPITPPAPTQPCARDAGKMVTLTGLDASNNPAAMDVIIGGSVAQVSQSPGAGTVFPCDSDTSKTWGYSGALGAQTWVALVDTTTPGPTARDYPAVAAIGNALYLHGGLQRIEPPPVAGEEQYLMRNDFWEGVWDFAAQTWKWTLLTSPAAPPLPTLSHSKQTQPGRSHHTLTYHQASNTLVMIGGCTGIDPVDNAQNCSSDFVDPAPLLSDDVWSWDVTNKTWTQKAPAAFGKRAQHVAVYDSARQRIVVHGGLKDAASTLDARVWEWDGTTWQILPVSEGGPEMRRLHGGAYDSARETFVMIGDGTQKEVWELELKPNTKPSMVIDFMWGQAGVPALASIDTMCIDVTARARDAAPAIPKDFDVQIEAWDFVARKWSSVCTLDASNYSSDANCPPDLSDSTPNCSLNDPGRFVFGDPARVNLRLIPALALASPTARLRLDYIDLTVDYTLP